MQSTRERERAERRKERDVLLGKADSNGKGNASGARNRPPKGKIREWLDALVFALVVMLVVRTLIFDLFKIPTPSMENSLLVGDYLFVSKLHYGTRTPVTLGIPFTQIYVRDLTLPHTRLPGFTEVKRGDPIVFNYPPEEKPVDRKMHYIKRVVGLPGETLEVRDKTVYLDGKPLPLLPTMQQYWYVFKKDPMYRLSEARLEALGISEVATTPNPNVLRIVATPGAADEIRSWPYIERVEPYVAPADPAFASYMYPKGSTYTPDNYGPVTIPKKGQEVVLNPRNWPVYEPVIRAYEGHATEAGADGRYLIDGKAVDRYTFRQDYYFVMGDNRDNSEDSRFWGFVPMDHIVGKAILTYFSWDSEARLPRLNRMFRPIPDELGASGN